VLNGDGLDIDLLMEAGIDRADAVLAVTDDDKTNLLVRGARQAAAAARWRSRWSTTPRWCR
jgi:trk system potassium uptake protein